MRRERMFGLLALVIVMVSVLSLPQGYAVTRHGTGRNISFHNWTRHVIVPIYAPKLSGRVVLQNAQLGSSYSSSVDATPYLFL